MPQVNTIDRTIYPTITCKPWCEFGDGHPDNFCREDQNCWTENQEVPLSLYPTIEGPSEAERMLDYLRAHAGQHADWAQPRYYVCQNDSLLVELTRDETRALRDALTALLDETEV